MSQVGFPITKDQLLDTVKDIVEKLEKETPFTNNRPSRAWYSAFLDRNKEISVRLSQNLTRRRADVKKCDILKWFTNIGNYISDKNLLNIDPERVFNLDESAFLLAPKGDKECYTTLLTGNQLASCFRQWLYIHTKLFQQN